VKVRNGFVSNSSSSSFIIGLAEIVDKEGLEKYLNEHDIKFNDGWDYPEIKSGSQLIEESNGEYATIYINNDEISIEAPVNYGPTISTKFDINKDYFIYDHGNNEGDSEFWDEGSGEMDYSIVDYNYFSKKEQIMIDIFNDNKFVKNGVYNIGAARNG
jgi:hypothetical protein